MEDKPVIALGYLSGLCYGVACLLIALVCYKLGMPKQYTRKVVHILVGFEWIFLYNFLGAGIHFLVVCLAFLSLLIVSHVFRLMPMISSDEDNSLGTVYYAVAMTGVALVGCFVPDVMVPFGIGIFCTSIGDGFAGFVGQIWQKGNPKIYFNKSLFGTLANFAASFVCAMVMTLVFELEIGILEWCIIAFLSAALELITPMGFDNISVTWGITAITYAFIHFDGIYNYIVPVILTPIVIALVKSRSVLTDSAIIAAIVVDFLISVSLGNFGFIILLLFLALSVVLDKIKKKFKNNRTTDEGLKGDTRDHMQVLANALVPALLAALFALTHSPIFVVAFVSALSEALSDTVASSMGAFSKRTFDLFRWRVCDNGISGGISLVGTLSALIAAFVLPLVALGFGALDFKLVIIAASAAFIGTFVDTMLGSLLQVKFICVKCEKITEKHFHCDKPTKYFRGAKAVDNDVVNLLSSLSSAIISVILCYIFIA